MEKTSHKLFDVWEEPGTSHPWKVQVKWGVFEHDTRAVAESIAAEQRKNSFPAILKVKTKHSKRRGAFGYTAIVWALRASRQLAGYSIASRDFANDFRRGFASMLNVWPNASVNYGPLTLMQGWIEVDSNSFEKEALQLMERFRDLSSLIDLLLESRRSIGRRFCR